MLDCSKIDELMMDWLYQELDESSSARVAEHVHGCPRCAAEATALQRTRAAFRELSPVEPPVAVSAILLHEAARRAPAAAAPARQADEGFWAWLRSWFRPIAMHPAAAAVATLVLVAGVAGALYVRHGDEMTDTPDLPTSATDGVVVRAEPPPPTPPALDVPVAPQGEAATPAPAATASGDEQADADREGYTADVLSKDGQAELSRRIDAAKLERAPADKGSFSTSIEKKPARTSRSKKAAKPAEPKGPIANAVSGADPLIDGKLDAEGGIGGAGPAATRGRAADTMQQQAAQPPPPPQSSPTTSSTAAPGAIDFADGDSGGYRVYKQKPMSAAELKASEGKLGAAVKKNDCLAAARIANDILDRNRDYYYKRVASQTRPCQMYVNKETARRASKNVGSGKNVAAPQKMKAAPQKDQAAESAE